MATNFCGTCGSAKVSTEDLFCRNCGRAYSSAESETAGDPTTQAVETTRLDTAPQPQVEPVSETFQRWLATSNSPTPGPVKNILLTRWSDFWKVLLDLWVIGGLFSLTQAKNFENMAGRILVLFFFCSLRWGLMRSRARHGPN
jgi:hypothetical protein